MNLKPETRFEWKDLLQAGCVVALGLVLAGCGVHPKSTAKAPGLTSTPANVSTTDGKRSATNRAAFAFKSEFHTGRGSGRDPFFPASDPRLASSAVAEPAVRLPLASYLRLTGIRPGKIRPMALINRTAMAPGEEAAVAVTIPGPANKDEVQKVNVRCLEIRRDSVVISIAGEPGAKELRLARAN